MKFKHFETKVSTSQNISFSRNAQGVCITASGNILANGNLYSNLFKLQLKVINKNVCYLCSV